MIGKIYRIQAFVSWALVGGLFLLIEFGDVSWLRSLEAAGVLSIWMAMAWIRTILPVGTVLAILAVLYWLVFLRCLPPRRIRRATAPEGYTAGDMGSVSLLL